MRPGPRSALVTALLCWPGLVACSGDDDPGQAQPRDDAATEQVRSELVAFFAGDHSGEDSTEVGECFADDLLDHVSPEELRTGGALTADNEVNLEGTRLSETVATAWTDAQFACTDFVEESTKAQVALSKGKLDTDVYAACLADRLDETTIREATVAALMADWAEPAVEEMTVAQSVCAKTALPAD